MIVFAKPEDLETWPNHLTFRFFALARLVTNSCLAHGLRIITVTVSGRPLNIVTLRENKHCYENAGGGHLFSSKTVQVTFIQ